MTFQCELLMIILLFKVSKGLVSANQKQGHRLESSAFYNFLLPFPAQEGYERMTLIVFNVFPVQQIIRNSSLHCLYFRSTIANSCPHLSAKNYF